MGEARVGGLTRSFRALAALLVLSASGPSWAQEPAPVRIATEGARPPFNYVENGEPAGFEVELGRALCDAAQLKCVFVLHEWEGLIKGLLAGEYDAIMASLTVTPKRKARVAFSEPYYRIPASFMARKNSDVRSIAPADLAGKSIGVPDRSDFLSFLEGRYPDAEIRPFDKVADANLDLLTERLDLVFADKSAVMEFLATREGACCRLVADVPPGQPGLGQGVAIAFRPADATLKGAFDAAIAKVKADGTYDRIRAKYIPFDTK